MLVAELAQYNKRERGLFESPSKFRPGLQPRISPRKSRLQENYPLTSLTANKPVVPPAKTRPGIALRLFSKCFIALVTHEGASQGLMSIIQTARW
jgi:hypothetical protein